MSDSDILILDIIALEWLIALLAIAVFIIVGGFVDGTKGTGSIRPEFSVCHPRSRSDRRTRGFPLIRRASSGSPAFRIASAYP
jgi:hypothetical protein